MKEVKVEGLVHLKSIKVPESKTNTRSEIVCEWECNGFTRGGKNVSRLTDPILKKLWRTRKQFFFVFCFVLLCFVFVLFLFLFCFCLFICLFLFLPYPLLKIVVDPMQ